MAVRRCLPLLGVVFCTLVTSCGGPSSRPSVITRARLLTAIDKTRTVQSARVVQTFSVVSPQANIRGRVTGDANFVSQAGTTIVEEGTVEEHAVFRDGNVWLTMNAPQFTRLLPSGKTWVQASTAELESLGAFHPLSDAFALLDALHGVRAIRQVAPNAATFTFSLAEAMAHTPASRRAALQAAIHASGDIQSETGAVVLTPSGAVRSESLRINGGGSNGGLHLQASLAISNVGEDVSPAPPPAVQVASLSSLPALRSALRSSATSSG